MWCKSCQVDHRGTCLEYLDSLDRRVTNSVTNNEPIRDAEPVLRAKKSNSARNKKVSIVCVERARDDKLAQGHKNISTSARVSVWREKNKERYVEYQREYMRKWRSEKKVAS